jgi:hypothetical protein
MDPVARYISACDDASIVMHDTQTLRPCWNLTFGTCRGQCRLD